MFLLNIKFFTKKILNFSEIQSTYFNYCSATVLLVKYFHEIPPLQHLRNSQTAEVHHLPTIALSFRLAEEYCRCKSASRHIRNSICVAQENKRDTGTRICYFPLETITPHLHECGGEKYRRSSRFNGTVVFCRNYI